MMSNMTWMEIGVILGGFIYIANAVGYGIKGEWPWCLTYFAYSMANCGLIWAAMWGRH